MHVAATSVARIFHVTLADVAADAQIGYMLCERLNAKEFEEGHGIHSASVLVIKYDPGHKTVLVVTTKADVPPDRVRRAVADAAEQCLRVCRNLRAAAEIL
jgi:hypothetical protein